MRVLLDCDGVLADFVGRCRDYVPNLAEPTRYDFVPYLPPDQTIALLAALGTSSFWQGMDPYPNRVAEVGQLDDVYVVTSPYRACPTWAYERTWWLYGTYFIPSERVIVTEAKHTVQGDVFVDDNPANVKAWQVANPKGKAYLFDQPYNQGANLPRVSSLVDITG